MASMEPAVRLPPLFRQSLRELADLAGRLREAAEGPESEQDLLQYRSLVEHIGVLAAERGLIGLHDVSVLMGRGLDALSDAPSGGLTGEALGAIKAWPTLVGIYLDRPQMAHARSALIAHLRRPCLRLTLPDAQAAGLAQSLRDWQEPESASHPPLDPADAVPPVSGPALLALLEASITDPGSIFDGAGVPWEDTAMPPLDGDALGEDIIFDGFIEAQADEVQTDEECDLFASEPSEPLPASDPPDTAAHGGAAIATVSPRRDLSEAVRDILEVICNELPELEAALSALSSEVGLHQGRPAALAILERLADVAAATGLAGLGTLCTWAVDNIQSGFADAASADDGAARAWAELPVLIRAYLRAPLDEQAVTDLVRFCRRPTQARPLDPVAALDLQKSLLAPDFSGMDADRPVRLERATDEAVSLAIPEDVNPELLETLLQELPQQSEDFSAAIQRVIGVGTPAAMTAAQRIAHTLKGASNTVGVRGLAELTHHLEDILLALVKYAAVPPAPLADCLIRAADCLEAMVESVTGNGPAPGDSREVLQLVLDWACRIDHDGVAALAAVTQSSSAPTPPAQTPSEQTPSGQTKPEQIPAARATQALPRPSAPIGIRSGEAVAPAVPASTDGADSREAAVLRVPAGKIDELLRLIGESMIHVGQVQNGVRSAHTRAHGIDEHLDRIGVLGAELERLVDLGDFAPAQADRDSPFDALELDQYSELHSCGRRLIEAAHDVRALGRELLQGLRQLDEVLALQDSLNRESQNCVLDTRLVSVRSIFPRLQRAARQACRLTGKEVQVELSGGDTAIDSDIMSRLVDPLMHLLRNAIDHGIEDPEQRRRAGKPPTGRVEVGFRRVGNSIHVRCADDGRGLDYAAIQRAAEEQGLLPAGSAPGTAELAACLLRPNFSTRREATQTSGRGVGLDIVSAGINALGGSLQIGSQDGRGATFELHLPVTLLTTHALLTRVGQGIFAVTSHGIERLLHIDDGVVAQVGGALMFRSGEQFFPAYTLDALLGLDGQGAPQTRPQHRVAIIVRCDAGRVAVLTEGVTTSRDVVIKSPGPYIRNIPGITGATILGDGTVTPVLDLSELARQASEAGGPAAATATMSLAAVVKHGRRALVVDDSLSARRALQQILADAGMDVRTAQDGVDAIDAMKQVRPDILFVDLEMPRLNGIELTAQVRATPEWAAIPIVMVTSRSTPRHREQADRAGVNAYFTKPFAEDALLDQTHTLLTGAQ